MGSMKKSMMGMAMMFPLLLDFGRYPVGTYTPREEEKREPIIPKGCKKFEFPGGITIVALNQKSADKKYAKLKQKSYDANR